MEKPFCVLFLLICIFFGYAEVAEAQTTYLWRGGSSGSWETPSNWSVGGVTQTANYPGKSASNDIAQINTSNVTITVSASHTIYQLQSTNYAVSGITVSVSASQTLTVTNGLNMAQPSSFSTVITFSGSGSVSIAGTSSFQYGGSMSISSGTTVSFTSGSTIDFTNNQGALTNNGTLNLTGVTFTMGYIAKLISTGTINASSSDFNMTNATSYISYAGTFVANSCSFEVPSGAYIKSTSSSASFTSTSCTFTLSGSGGAAYIYNNGTYRDHKSTFNLSGQGAYIQNAASSAMHFSGTTVNFSTSGGSNNQYINNAGTFTADSSSVINAATYTSYVTNSGTFYAGTSGSSCVITLSGQQANVSNTGTFNLGSTSIIYPSSYEAAVTNSGSGVFTLKSDSLGTAAIGALSSTAVCNGVFNVERYFQGSSVYDNVKSRWLARSYRIISSAVHNSTKVNNNYVFGLNYIVGSTAGQTTAASSLTNAFITGCAGGSTSAGNPSTYLYRESYTPANATFTDGNFIGITDITNSSSSGSISGSDGGTYSLPVGTGALFFFRGAATNWSTRTKFPYIAPEDVTLTSTGYINQQSFTIKDWYSPTSSNLAYTGSGTGGNYAVRGFNMVGNPYPCTIDWCTAYSGAGITRTHINPTIYVFNPVTNQYDTFIATSSSGGTATGNGSRYIMSGQGFFVQANATGASLVFTESAKAATSLLTGSNLLMSAPGGTQADVSRQLRLKLSLDSLNYDDIAFNFNSSASTAYNYNEDAAYLPGNGALEGLSSFSSDSVRLSINSLPLPKLQPEVIRLSLEAHKEARYKLERTGLDAIPKLYEIWLVDNDKKDSLDLRNNSTYLFDVSFADTASYGNNRFQIVISENPALMVHLLQFSGKKATDGAQITWNTENEENYTYFTVERSSDGGATFNVVGSATANGQGAYVLLDKNPPAAADMYRLKIEDLNGTVTYSNIVTLMYGNNTNTLAKAGVSIYPNPVSSALNLTINPTPDTGNTTGGNFNIEIANILGARVRKTSVKSQTWQTNVGNLAPGTYVLKVTDDNGNSIGTGTFIKL